MQVERWPRSVSFITERFKFFHAAGECYPPPSSVPLLARHLLPYWRRLLLSCSLIALDRSCPLSQSVTPDSRTQPCPAARPKGKNEESPGWSLLRTERFKFFPATGGRQVARATPCFHPIDFHVTRSLLCFFPCTPRAAALRQARVSGGNLQYCAPSAACGGAMTQERIVPSCVPFLPHVSLVLYAMLTLSLPPPST